MTDYVKQLSADFPAGGNGLASKGLFLLLALFAAFFIRFYPYGDLLMATGAAAAAIGTLSVFAPSLSEKSADAFWTASIFFLIVIIGQGQPAFIAAAWGTWILRKALTELPSSGGWAVFARPASSFIIAFALLFWTSAGTLTLLSSLTFTAVLLAVAAFVRSRLRPEDTAPLPELAAVTVLAAMYGFNPVYMLYGQPLILSAGVATVCALLLYKVSLIGKAVAPTFAIYGSIVYFAFDTSGFTFFIVFLIICETGDRINKRDDSVRLMNRPGQFPARALPAILISAVSLGYEDPFLFYLAFAGSLSAATFMQWFPEVTGKQAEGITGLKNFIRGSIGASLMAICASLFYFIPSEAVPIVLLAGVSPILTIHLAKTLAEPERDAKYLPAIFGAAASAFLHNIFLLS